MMVAVVYLAVFACLFYSRLLVCGQILILEKGNASWNPNAVGCSSLIDYLVVAVSTAMSEHWF